MIGSAAFFFVFGVGQAGADCPESRAGTGELPGVVEEDRKGVTWSDDSILLDAAQIRATNAAWKLKPTAEVRQDLTRAVLVESAMRLLGRECGGDAPCSAVLPELLGSLGLAIPSGDTSDLGTFSIDMDSISEVAERRRIVESAHARGLVLIRTPGGDGLYLGGARGGRVLLPLVDWSEACPEAGRTRVVEGRVVIAPLEGVEDESGVGFLGRANRIFVFGESPGPALSGIVSLRPAAMPPVVGSRDCDDSMEFAFYTSPEKAASKSDVRVIATLEKDPGPVVLVVRDRSGKLVETVQRTLGGPPFTRVATLQNAPGGRYTAVLGDGERVLSCTRFTVHRRVKAKPQRKSAEVWPVTRQWSRGTENLFSAFVEGLFDYPITEDLTWPRLQELLNQSDKNLLHNHLGLREDDVLKLEPDCADLPHVLRAYFAWKMGLPFAHRKCGAGWKGNPPKCGMELVGNTTEVEGKTRIEAFREFVFRVMNGVHSGGTRTAPDAEASDFYPVALTRSALRPGTMFADPHGHVLLIARWLPQEMERYGILVGSDAQPDGTVGRRRFWRGSFLFTSSTEDVGAGFKAYRPIRWKRSDNTLRAYDNSELASTRKFRRISGDQHKGSTSDFYEAIEGLINPRPLDPVAMQVSLVDSLEESVSRRLNSVNNAEVFMADQGYASVEMPTGASIFQTVGPWEDFSTPSRDMRLLISLDTVLGFPDLVRRHPERFGANAESGDVLADAVDAALKKEMKSRIITYMRSNGEAQRLTLRVVASRARALEMAYNPNDCVEIRWGAPPDSAEYQTCKRFASEEQRDRMASYREWFVTRSRPPRGASGP